MDLLLIDSYCVCPSAPKQVRMTQEVANFFVSEARRNMHRANSINEEDDLLVYNWIPHFTGEPELNRL